MYEDYSDAELVSQLRGVINQKCSLGSGNHGAEQHALCMRARGAVYRMIHDPITAEDRYNARAVLDEFLFVD